MHPAETKALNSLEYKAECCGESGCSVPRNLEPLSSNEYEGLGRKVKENNMANDVGSEIFMADVS